MVMYAGRTVEEASTEEILDDPRHPYTKGLIACVPHLEEAPPPVRAALTEIPGVVPALTDPGAGCSFAPRCAHADDRCRRAAPPPRDVGGNHRVALLAVRGGRTRHDRRRGCGENGGEGGRRRRPARGPGPQGPLPAAAPEPPDARGNRSRGGRYLLHGAPRLHLRYRRRERLGQDDRGPRRHASRARYRGLDQAGRRRADDPRGRSAAPDAAQDPDRLPGPLLIAQPAHARRRDRARANGPHGGWASPANAAPGSPSCFAAWACARSRRPCSRISSRAASASASGSRGRSRPSPS